MGLRTGWSTIARPSTVTLQCSAPHIWPKREADNYYLEPFIREKKNEVIAKRDMILRRPAKAGDWKYGLLLDAAMERCTEDTGSFMKPDFESGGIH